MGSQIADFIVHLDPTLPPEEQCHLEDYVRDQACVVGVGISTDKPHLMMVAYDADCSSASDILHKIQDKGIGAELVGM
jgi:hypothetical protein